MCRAVASKDAGGANALDSACANASDANVVGGISTGATPPHFSQREFWLTPKGQTKGCWTVRMRLCISVRCVMPLKRRRTIRWPEPRRFRLSQRRSRRFCSFWTIVAPCAQWKCTRDMGLFEESLGGMGHLCVDRGLLRLVDRILLRWIRVVNGALKFGQIFVRGLIFDFSSKRRALIRGSRGAGLLWRAASTTVWRRMIVYHVERFRLQCSSP